MQIISFIAFVSPFLLGSLAAPLTEPSSSRDVNQRVFNIARRGIKTQPPVTNYDEFIFDPSYPKREIQRVLSKYRQAAHLIHNTHLPKTVAQYRVSDFVSPDLNSSYNGEASTPRLNNIRQAATPLTDHMSGNLDILYYGPIQMGSASQRMTFDIDTGSADLWVPVNCNNCPHPSYNPRSSSTYRSSQVPFEVTYGSGSVSGTLAQERVTIGSLVVDDQYFGAVDSESEDFQDSPNDGLIGMAFSTIASSGKPTFFENLLSANKVAAPIFSVHLARHQATGSELCLGCYDSSKANGPVSWAPVTSRTYWAVSMPGILVNGNPVDMPTDVTAAIDTGTTLIYFPQRVATAFYHQIPGARTAEQYGSGFWTYPCAANLNISFQFGDNHYILNTLDFNLGRTSSGSATCVGGILSLDNGFPSDLAIIGDEFLKSWYTVYDYSHGARVGFAPSVNNT